MIPLPTFCRNFYASHYIPIAAYQSGSLVYHAGLPSGIYIADSIIYSLRIQDRTPAVFSAADSGLYGFIRVSGTDSFIILGPAYSTKYTRRILHEFMTLSAVPDDLAMEPEPYLAAIPHYSYNRFLNMLAFAHLVMNDEEVSVTEHFEVPSLGYQEDIAAYLTENAYLARYEGRTHGTYFFEQRMLGLVRRGRTHELHDYLLSSVQNAPLSEGKLADAPLRQAKNIFIGTVSMVGKTASIPGGMDVEETYQLIDTYVQECERASSIDSVYAVQFNMLMDFTNRVARAQRPTDISGEIYDCVRFIRSHINERISLDDVAAHIGKSRAYTTAAFKAETGFTIAAFIAKSRMEEAAALLQYTDKPIAEISEYLCYSSPSYFSNQFKKCFGDTPAKYRRIYLLEGIAPNGKLQ